VTARCLAAVVAGSCFRFSAHSVEQLIDLVFSLLLAFGWQQCRRFVLLGVSGIACSSFLVSCIRANNFVKKLPLARLCCDANTPGSSISDEVVKLAPGCDF
jgi:hypothetical protein